MSYPYYNPAPAPMVGETEQGKAIKKSLGSAIFLVAVISNTLMVVLSVVSSIIASNNMLGMVLNVIEQIGRATGTLIDYGEIYEVFEQILPIIKITSIVAMIPSMVICLALWLTYTGARKNAPVKGTAGLTILQVFAILSLIGLCLSGLLVIIIMIPSIAGSGMLDEYLEMQGAATGIVVGIFVVIIAILVFQIVYYAKLSGLYAGAKALSRNERVRKKASVFVIVISIITVVGSLISLVTAVVGTLSVNRYVMGMNTMVQYVSLASVLFQFLYSLFLAITYIKLRSAEEPFTHGIQNPAYMAYEPVAGTAPKPYGTYDMYNQPQQAQPMANPYPTPQPQAPQYSQYQAPYGVPQYQNAQPYQAPPQPYMNQPVQGAYQAPNGAPQYQAPYGVPQYQQSAEPVQAAPAAPQMEMPSEAAMEAAMAAATATAINTEAAPVDPTENTQE